MKISKKKGLSEVVGYALLISVTISLSILVYAWLKYYPEIFSSDVPTCPEDVNLVITNVDCYANGYLEINLANKGKFKIDGYLIRYHIRDDAEFGIYDLQSTLTQPLKPGESYTERYESTDYQHPGQVKLIEVQPFRSSTTQKIICPSSTKQKVKCNV